MLIRRLIYGFYSPNRSGAGYVYTTKDGCLTLVEMEDCGVFSHVCTQFYYLRIGGAK